MQLAFQYQGSTAQQFHTCLQFTAVHVHPAANTKQTPNQRREPKVAIIGPAFPILKCFVGNNVK